MKRIALFLFSVLLLWGYSKEPTVEIVSFTDSGCSNEIQTRAAGDSGSRLILEYSNRGLVITRNNALMNCSIKEGGIVCEVSAQGNVIRYNAYERDGKTLRCTCPVETMTTVVGGLRPGSEYILHYSCDGSYLPINFTYDKGLKMVIDLSLYML